MSKFLNLVGKFNYLLEADGDENQMGDDLNQVGNDLEQAVNTPTPTETPQENQTPQDSQSALPQLSPEQLRTLGKFAIIYLKKNKDQFDSAQYLEMLKLLNNNTDDSVLKNITQFLNILPGSKVVIDKDPTTEE